MLHPKIMVAGMHKTRVSFFQIYSKLSDVNSKFLYSFGFFTMHSNSGSSEYLFCMLASKSTGSHPLAIISSSETGFNGSINSAMCCDLSAKSLFHMSSKLGSEFLIWRVGM